MNSLPNTNNTNPNNTASTNGTTTAAAAEPRQRRRSRVNTENAIAASVASDAANPENDGELPTVEVSLPPARRASANTPAPRKPSRSANRSSQSVNASDTQSGVTPYVVLTLSRPRKMHSLVFTLFCGFAGELQSQNAAFVAPKAEPLLRELFADSATYLMHVQQTDVIPVRNIAIGNVHGIGLLTNHALLVKSAVALRRSALLPGAESPVDGGRHWNNCSLRRDLKKLAVEAEMYAKDVEVKAEGKTQKNEKKLAGGVGEGEGDTQDKMML